MDNLFKNKKLFKTQMIFTFVSILLGVVLHFTYQLSEENRIVAIFSAINESTWEHLKLAFFPIIICAIIEYFIVRNEANNYIIAKTVSAIFSMIFIVVVFYTYTGVIGTNYPIIDILIFVIAVTISELFAYKIMISNEIKDKTISRICIITIIVISISFAMFTYNAPKINIFKDPILQKNTQNLK